MEATDWSVATSNVNADCEMLVDDIKKAVGRSSSPIPPTTSKKDLGGHKTLSDWPSQNDNGRENI